MHLPLFHEDKPNGHDETDKCRKVIPMKRLATEKDGGKHDKDNKRDDFLYHLELHERERTAILVKPNAVGRNLHTIFYQRDAP